MKAVLIDNNDSFTYNIVELIRKIPGSVLTVLSSSSLRIEELEEYDKFIISPGPGLPYEFPVLKEIIKKYYREKSMLGICLGHEAIAQFFGAELAHLPLVVHGQSREISVLGGSEVFKNIPKKFNVGLYHSWVIDKIYFPKNLEIIGISEDKNIMAYQHKELKLFGFQFHPESIITEYGKELMENFLNI
jgi:anthranilate synthase/aminodeoxychorismate synthase-like glutamine amidotransferase